MSAKQTDGPTEPPRRLTPEDLLLMKDFRALRLLFEKSQTWVANESGTSLPTVRLFEANPNAVSPPKRKRILPVYEALEARIAAGELP